LPLPFHLRVAMKNTILQVTASFEQACSLCHYAAALANTGIVLKGNWIDGLATFNSLGIFAILLLGKPLGIALFSLLAVKLSLSHCQMM
jgi:Na+/H+ antiporter NhaA